MCTLSIVMPVYNAEIFLDGKLKKISEQLSIDIELIVINDGSTDNSLQICQNRLSGRPNTAIVSQQNQGLSCARNRGIEEAHGEYIMFLDCDDELVFTTLEDILATLLQKKPDVLMGKYYFTSYSGLRLPKHYTFPTAMENPVEYIYNYVPDSIWNAWRYICKRHFLIKGDLWFTPNILCEDVDWTPRILEAATHIEFWDIPFYIYFYRFDSIMNTVSFKKTLDLNYTIKNNFQLYQGKSYQISLYKRLAQESFHSLSDFPFFTKEQRNRLKDIFCFMGFYYQQYGSILVKIFGYAQPLLPIYLWSFALCTVKKIRKTIRSFYMFGLRT